MGLPERAVTLRFLAAPTDIAFVGSTAVGGGRVLEWIDKAAYACAVGWSGGYCVTAYIGNVNFTRGIHSGELVEVKAVLVHTGRTSMHVEVEVASANPENGRYHRTTSCSVIFVAMGRDTGRPEPVRQWIPEQPQDKQRDAVALDKIAVRADIEAAMREQTYTNSSEASRSTLRFLAAPTDVNWGGKTHGGTVCRWIDEAAYVCASGWSGGMCLAAYSGGIRFYRPIQIGHIVQVQARLLYTSDKAMHISVHVSSADPAEPTMVLTTHCLTVFVVINEHGKAVPIPQWVPVTDEDKRLGQHAQDLIRLRSRLAPVHPT